MVDPVLVWVRVLLWGLGLVLWSRVGWLMLRRCAESRRRAGERGEPR